MQRRCCNFVAQFQALHHFLDGNNVGYVDATMRARLIQSANAEDVLKTRGVASEGTVPEEVPLKGHADAGNLQQ